MKWFRMYHGAQNDKKWMVISRKSGQPIPLVLSVVWELIDQASRAATRGDVTGFDQEECAAFLGVSEDDITAVYKALEEKEWIVEGQLITWNKRQPKREDPSKERTRKWRSKERRVTNGDGSVTQSDALEESRIDIKKKSIKEKFEEFWKEYPKKIGKGAAKPKYEIALKKTSHEEIMAGVKNYKFNHDKQFIPNPATWLFQERWLDEEEKKPEPINFNDPEWWRERTKSQVAKKLLRNDWPVPAKNFPDGCPIANEIWGDEL